MNDTKQEDDEVVVWVYLDEGKTPRNVAQNANDDFAMICKLLSANLVESTFSLGTPQYQHPC